MNLAKPILTTILCVILYGIVKSGGLGVIPAPYLPIAADATLAAIIIFIFWLVEAATNAAQQPLPAPVDPGKPAGPAPAGPPAPGDRGTDPAATPATADGTSPTPIPAGGDFDRCVAITLKWEGGNDDDPRDSGGRTSRGITAADWADWRKTHPGLPADDWQAPQDQILAIYREKYWNALWCDSLPPGVDLAVFDHGVLGGIFGSAKLLQTLVGTDADGEIGPLTIAAAASVDPVDLVNRFCDARLAHYQSLNRPEYIKGWTNRCVDVKKEALALAATAPKPKSSTLPPTAPPAAPPVASTPPWLALARSLIGTHAQHDNATIMAWPAAIAAKFPDMADYCKGYVHDSIPWCGLTVAYVMAMNGVRPVFGSSDTDKFLWAFAWQNWGTDAMNDPRPGDVCIFRWSGGGGHVTLYDHEVDDDYYHCTGGNQGSGHVVSTEAMPMGNCIAIRRPPT